MSLLVGCWRCQCKVVMQHAVCRCQYVTYTGACKAEQHYVAYLQRFYCAGRASRWLLFIGYLLWMLILFYALSEVAESFLVPAVEVRSCIIHAKSTTLPAQCGAVASNNPACMLWQRPQLVLQPCCSCLVYKFNPGTKNYLISCGIGAHRHIGPNIA